jgi:SAM-dependent methyltransferase
VFHFLTDKNDREFYLQNLRRTLKPGGHFILATLAADGPVRCSGLDVERYDLQRMVATVGPGFELLANERELHQTPSGSPQSFQYGHFRYTGA